MTDALYHCALPLTDIASITETMVTDAFASISQMYYGGDAPEDVLMGKFDVPILKRIVLIFNRIFRNRFL